MPGRLQPDAWVTGVHELTPEWLEERGITALLVDLDNTLTAWRSRDLPEASIAWLKMLREQGIPVCLVSNSRAPRRVGHIAETHGLPFVAWANKPRGGGFRRALEHLALESTEGVAMVGDQLFTDILGARRAGLYAILVEPLSMREFVGTMLIRRLERWILPRYGLKPPPPLPEVDAEEETEDA